MSYDRNRRKTLATIRHDAIRDVVFDYIKYGNSLAMIKNGLGLKFDLFHIDPLPIFEELHEHHDY